MFVARSDVNLTITVQTASEQDLLFGESRVHQMSRKQMRDAPPQARGLSVQRRRPIDSRTEGWARFVDREFRELV